MYYNFNPSLPEPLNVIHPIQVKSVQKLLENKFPDEIEMIILYGGSLDLACGINSDLDLYVITGSEDRFGVYKAISELCLPLKKPYDILVSSMRDYLDLCDERGTVEYRIKRQGVCIYAKREGYFA